MRSEPARRPGADGTLAGSLIRQTGATTWPDGTRLPVANRHIEAMVARWLERGLATAPIHNYLSFLRTFAGWIGKVGMVREPEF